MYLIQPKSETAKQWIDENVQTEPWQWLGDSLAIDHHYIDTIATAIQEVGLIEEFNIVHA